MLNPKKTKGRSCDQVDFATNYHTENETFFQEPPVRCLLCTWRLVFSSLCRYVQPPRTPTRQRGTHQSSVSVPIWQLVALIDYAMQF